MSEDALESQSDSSVSSPTRTITCIKMLCNGIPKVVKHTITAASVAQKCVDSGIGLVVTRRSGPPSYVQQRRCLGQFRHIRNTPHDIDDKRLFQIVIFSRAPVIHRDDGCFRLHHETPVCTTRGAHPVEQGRG